VVHGGHPLLMTDKVSQTPFNQNEGLIMNEDWFMDLNDIFTFFFSLTRLYVFSPIYSLSFL
jgi:hypothetical protein